VIGVRKQENPSFVISSATAVDKKRETVRLHFENGTVLDEPHRVA
jgi:hypothetical protein